MKQNNIFTILVASVLLSGCNDVEMLSTAKVGEKPKRSECIVGISFSKGSEPITVENDLSPIVEKLIKKLNIVYKEEGGEIYPSMSMNWEKSVLYVQFPYRCEDKLSFTKEALSSVGIDSFRYELIRGVIAPSINTIDVRGPYWSED